MRIFPTSRYRTLIKLVKIAGEELSTEENQEQELGKTRAKFRLGQGPIEPCENKTVILVAHFGARELEVMKQFGVGKKFLNSVIGLVDTSVMRGVIPHDSGNDCSSSVSHLVGAYGLAPPYQRSRR